MKKKIPIEFIECALNLIAQDFIFESHKDKLIEDFINEFKSEEIRKWKLR